MATTLTFPKNPKVGDRVEFVSISSEKLPINIVGNADAGKALTIMMLGQTYTGDADGSTTILSLNYSNCVFTFKCVSTAISHTWVAEGSGIYAALEARVSALEAL